MAKRTFLADLDLTLNQLLQARLENLASDPTGVEGRIYYNTTSQKAKYYGKNKAGTLAWLTIMDETHDHSEAQYGAQIDHTKLSNIGENTHGAIDTHISNAAIHRSIDDATISATSLYSSTKIEALISAVNSSIAGALLFKGGYDAATNTPALDATPIAGIKQGWTYVVTVPGTFFSTALAVGDMIIATQDTPELATHWTIVNKDIPDIVAASETAAGILEIATKIETETGTDNTRAITPLRLREQLGVTATNQEAYKDKAAGLSLPRKFSQAIGNGTATTYTVTHNIGSASTVVTVNRVASPYDEVECEIIHTSVNAVIVNFNVAPTLNQYNVTVIG